MQDTINQLFLILNIKSEKHNTTYNYQIEIVYNSTRKEIFPKRRILKYVGGKLAEKIFVNGKVDTIKFLNDEIKKYN